MDNYLKKEDILKYLKLLNEELEKDGKYGEIIMAGGAALTLVHNARDSTHDIDAIFEPKTDLKNIIKKIADKYHLNEDWLNDGVKGFFTKKMTYHRYLKYSHLTINTMDTACLLALKLTSARALSKDMEDSITLMKILKVKQEEELFGIVEKYIPKNRQTAQAYFFTKEAFTKYKKENRLLIERALDLEDDRER